MRWTQWLLSCMTHNMMPHVIQQYPQLYSSDVGDSAQWICVSDIPACLVRTGCLHLITDKLMPLSCDTDFLLGSWKPQPQQLHQLPLAKPCRKFINVHKVQYFFLLCVCEPLMTLLESKPHDHKWKLNCLNYLKNILSICFGGKFHINEYPKPQHALNKCTIPFLTSEFISTMILILEL